MTETMTRRLVAELLGTGLLVAVVVGSGIAAQRLSTGDVGLQLLENSTATFLGLTVLILVFGFKPVVGLNHVAVHTDPTSGAVTILTMQIYASHYIEGSLGMNALMPEPTTSR